MMICLLCNNEINDIHVTRVSFLRIISNRCNKCKISYSDFNDMEKFRINMVKLKIKFAFYNGKLIGRQLIESVDSNGIPKFKYKKISTMFLFYPEKFKTLGLFI